MKIEIKIKKVDKVNRIQSPKTFIKEIEDFSKYLPSKSISEYNYVDHIDITRSIQSYKISNDYNKRKMIVDTESIQIAAKVCSFLKHHDIRYKIKINEELRFGVEEENLVELYESSDPTKLISKLDYREEENDYEEYDCYGNPCIMDNYYNKNSFTFCFNSSIFDSNIVTNEMCCDALKKCEIHYECSTKKLSKKLKRSDIQRIEFTEYGLNEISIWVNKYREILNIPYEKLELKLATLNLIECD